jgi:tripartite-type tricarboxylate transporter receptor subunit TctC
MKYAAMMWAACFALASGMGTACAAFAADPGYPSRPVRLVVPYPPGGNADIVARLIGGKLGEALGQQVIIDNRGGAGGLIGEAVAARANPDGYTLVLVAVSHVVNPSLHKALPYDAKRDFVPVAYAVSVPNLLVVHPALPAKSVRELISLAKSKPGELSYGSSGNGTSLHLAGELFNAMAGTDIVRVIYKGSVLAATDLFAGRIGLMFDVITTGLANARSGRVRALGVTSEKRAAISPEIPAISEFVPGYAATGWQGVLAPRGTSPAVVGMLNEKIRAILIEPSARDRFLAMGAEPAAMSPAEFGRFMDAEMTKWAKVLKAAGIQAD